MGGGIGKVYGATNTLDTNNQGLCVPSRAHALISIRRAFWPAAEHVTQRRLLYGVNTVFTKQFRGYSRHVARACVTIRRAS